MCIAEFGVVESVAHDAAVVRTRLGTMTATVLLVPEVAVGDHVTLHSGHVLAVVDEDEVAAVQALRRAAGPDVPPGASTTGG